VSGVGLGWVVFRWFDWFGWLGWFEGLVVWLRDEMAQRRLYFLVTQKVLFFLWCQMCWLAFAFVISQSRHIVKMFFLVEGISVLKKLHLHFLHNVAM